MDNIDAMCRAGCTSRRGIRHWETLGLLGEVARSSGDTRQYTAAQLDKARVIAAAQFGGWSLEEIGAMLPEYDSSGEVYEAIMTRLSDQARAIVRLGDGLPVPLAAKPQTQEYDL